MKKTFLSVVLAVIFLFGAVTASTAAMWIGTESGLVFSSPMTVTVNTPAGNNQIYNTKARSTYGAGLVIGYDFLRTGAGAAAYPDWMRYFSVSMGISYNQLGFSSQTRNLGAGSVVLPSVDGNNIGLTLMLIAKAPLMPNTDYPNGRLQPFVGVGPTVIWTSMDFNNVNQSGNQTSVNVGVVADAGLRFFVTPTFSADVLYRYRYLNPSFDVNLPVVGKSTVNSGVSNHMALARLNIHF